MNSNSITVAILILSQIMAFGQAVIISDNFDDGALAPHWSFDNRPFETGTIDIGGGIVDGAMRLEVSPLSDYWGGFALRSERTFSASESQPLQFQITRVADEGSGIRRSGVWISNSDRSQYVFVTQNVMEGGWQVNRRIGQEGDNPTGIGINMEALDSLDDDLGAHTLLLEANGSTVSVSVNGILGAEVAFPLSEGIQFAFGTYARSVDDEAIASFDDIEIRSDLATGFPCVTLTSNNTALFAGETTQATLTVPRLFLNDNATSVTITSSDPDVATLQGADASGSLTLSFPAGGENTIPLEIIPQSGGQATFELSAPEPLCVGAGLSVSISSSIIRNPSFEASAIGEWPGYGEVAMWLGGGGVNNGEITPFADNGQYPDGSIVAFNQGSNSLSQELSGLDPSKIYHLSFRYNARACCGGTINLEVAFDDQAIGDPILNVQPVGESNPYHTFTAAFQPATPTGTLSLITAAEGDATLVFDAVSLVERTLEDVPLSNPSFEASGRAPEPGYLVHLSGWTSQGNVGVNVGGAGPFANNGIAPDQDLVAFIQDGDSFLSQTINSFLAGETYTLQFAVNAREGNAPGLRVSLDDNILLEETITPVGGANPFHMRSVEFTATDVTHTITFTQTAAGDHSLLLDDVRILGEASTIPCVPVGPEKFSATVGQTGDALTIHMPEEAVAEGPVSVTVTSSNPEAIALLGGASASTVVLEFSADGELTQSASYEAVSKGQSILALSPSKLLCLERSSVTARALSTLVRNPGFESNYNETYPHYSPIDEWNGPAGGTGLNRADGPFHDNGLIPDGHQVGFAQGSVSIAQEVGGLAVGAPYWLQFHYNTRNCCGGTIGLVASFGEQELFRVDALEMVGIGEAYHFAQIPFIPESASDTLTFAGTAEGDATFLLDALTIVPRPETDLVIINPSFEATGAAALPAPGYLGTMDGDANAPLAGWEAQGSYGVNASGIGPFADNGLNPDQDDVVFLQGAGSMIRQTVSGLIPGSTYTLSYHYNARSGNTPTLQVEIGGNLAQQTFVSPVGGEQPYHTHTFSFQATSDSADLQFAQMGAGDQTVLLDDVRVYPGGEALPCVTVSPGQFTSETGIDQTVSLTAPVGAFTELDTLTITLTSSDSTVATVVPTTLTFTSDGPNSQAVRVATLAPGSASISLAISEGACLSRDTIEVTVTETVVPEGYVQNGSFEEDTLPVAPGYGPIAGWIIDGTGNSGINDAAGPFHNNGVIPEGDQVALMQNTLTMSQEVAGLEEGKMYLLEFAYNVREGYAFPDLTVSVDDDVLATLAAIEPVGGQEPYHFQSLPFAAKGSRVTLRFATVVGEGDDGTLLLDAVRIQPVDGGGGDPSPLPVLTIESQALTWPISFEGWTLQESLDLETWSTSALEVEASDDRWMAPLTLDGARHFYRLGK